MFKKTSKKSSTEKAKNDQTNSEQVTKEAPKASGQPDRLIPIKTWPKLHPWPPEGGLRHIRFWAEEKGATHCFVKKGGRVLIREQAFLKWASTNDIA